MTLFLGIDGGGTGCRAAVCDAAGRILREARGGPSNIATDPDRARANILAAARKALPPGTDPQDVVAVMGLAGANVAGSVARFRQGLPFPRLRIETDALISAVGALGHRDGVAAAIGTGSVFAVQRCGLVRQIGGWGLVLGDEGSGAWLGRAILARCLKALDGAVPMTPLLRQLLERYAGGDGIVAFAAKATPAEFAALSPMVSGAEDPAAAAVMARAMADVTEAIDLLQGSDRLPVVFLGGLGPVYSSRLADRWPTAEPLGTALDGALSLARGHA